MAAGNGSSVPDADGVSPSSPAPGRGDGSLYFEGANLSLEDPIHGRNFHSREGPVTGQERKPH